MLIGNPSEGKNKRKILNSRIQKFKAKLSHNQPMLTNMISSKQSGNSPTLKTNTLSKKKVS